MLKTTSDFLLEAVEVCDPPTKYRLGKVLDVRPSQIARYLRTGRSMDDRIALKVAELIGTKPEYMLACMAAERAALPQARRAWKKVVESLAAAVLLGAVVVGEPRLAYAGNILHNALQTTHYATWRRLWAWLSGAKLAL